MQLAQIWLRILLTTYYRAHVSPMHTRPRIHTRVHVSYGHMSVRRHVATLRHVNARKLKIEPFLFFLIILKLKI